MTMTYRGSMAENYQRHFEPVIPARLAPELLDRAAPIPGEHVLDVGTGTGVVARLAAERVGGDGAVVAVDPAADMLAVARGLPTPAGATIDWREGSAEALPVPDESFDLVVSQLALMLVGDRRAAAAAWQRALSPGGRVAVAVPGAIVEVFQVLEDAIARHLGPAVAAFVGAVFSLHDPTELAGLLGDAGFTEVDAEVGVRTFELPPPPEFLWGYVHATPLATVTSTAPAGAIEAFEHDVVGRWARLVDDDGRFRLRQPIVVATATRP